MTNSKLCRVQNIVQHGVSKRIRGLRASGKSDHYAWFVNNTCKRIISEGSNKDSKDGTRTIHAEVSAFRKLTRKNQNMSSVNLIVIRHSKTGKLGNSLMCARCQGTVFGGLQKIGINIGSIFYSDSSGNIIEGNKNSLPAYICSKDRKRTAVINKLAKKISEVKDNCCLVDENGNHIHECEDGCDCDEETDDAKKGEQRF